MIKAITELYNTQRGECLIIGGGNSVNDFDFSKIKAPTKVMAINRCFIDIPIDYQIYSDYFFIEWIEKNPIQARTVLVGLDSKSCRRTDYSFNFFDIVEGFHTGYYGLQIAQLIGFDKIYLIGYDYYDVDGKLHYYEGKHGTVISDRERQMLMREMNRNRWINDFNNYEWKAEIINCNPKSRLTKFKFLI